jgi:hypothetical protein
VGEGANEPAQVDITNKEELESFLKDKPRKWGQVIANRAALRGLPMMLGIFFPVYDRPEQKLDPLLFLLRGLLLNSIDISRNNIINNSTIIKNISNKCKLSANQMISKSGFARASFAQGYAITDSASRISQAIDNINKNISISVQFSADAAGYAIKFAGIEYNEDIESDEKYIYKYYYPTWKIITDDINFLIKGKTVEDLVKQPLGKIEIDWSDIDNEKSPVEDIFNTHWNELKKLLILRNENWQMWTEWYEDIRDGKLPWGLSRNSAQNVVLKTLQIQEIDWEKGPNHVNILIKQIIQNIVNEEINDIDPPHPYLIPDQDKNGYRFDTHFDGPISIESRQSYSEFLFNTPPRQDEYADIREKAEALRAEGVNRCGHLYGSIERFLAISPMLGMVRVQTFWSRMNTLRIKLGSGLIDHSQKMTAAAMAMAEKKVWAHRS